jgi:proton-coupled amino acid transporter
MRRHYVIHKAVERGDEHPVVLRSFVDFLFLYGHFAGEDLDEDDDDMDLDEEAGGDDPGSSGLRQRNLNRQDAEALGERAPLLRDQTRGRSVARMKRGKSVGKTGDATVFQAVLMVSRSSSAYIVTMGMVLTSPCSQLLKGFVGTGVLFLGKAFFNGGILFSTIVMLGIAAISLWSFLLLVKTRLVIPGSFGGEPAWHRGRVRSDVDIMPDY